MRKPKTRSLVEGGVVAALGAAVLLLIPSQVRTIGGLQTEMSPGFIPALVGAGLILAGIGLVVQSVFGGSSGKEIAYNRIITLRVVSAILLLLAYTFLFPRIGFVVTSALFIGIFTYLFGARSWVKIGLLVVLTPIGVWLFFEKLFRIPLPHGFLY